MKFCLPTYVSVGESGETPTSNGPLSLTLSPQSATAPYTCPVSNNQGNFKIIIQAKVSALVGYGGVGVLQEIICFTGDSCQKTYNCAGVQKIIFILRWRLRPAFILRLSDLISIFVLYLLVSRIVSSKAVCVVFYAVFFRKREKFIFFDVE